MSLIQGRLVLVHGRLVISYFRVTIRHSSLVFGHYEVSKPPSFDFDHSALCDFQQTKRFHVQGITFYKTELFFELLKKDDVNDFESLC